MKPLAVVSADKEILELARSLDYDVKGFFDPHVSTPILDFLALGGDGDFVNMRDKISSLQVAMAIDPCSLKVRLFEIYQGSFATLISLEAFISPSAVVGEGSIVQMAAKVMAGAHIGKLCKLNVNSVVHHDCRVGDFCTIAPSALLLGNVVVGDRVYIGAGAIILPRCRVGSDVIIGAGAVVTGDVESGACVVGVPARPIKRTGP